MLGDALQNGLVEADEGAAEDEEDVGRVDGVLVYLSRRGWAGLAGRVARRPAAHECGGGTGRAVVFNVYGDLCAFYELEQGLLHAFAAYIAAVDGFAAGDLVEFVEDDDALFCGFGVIVCFDKEALDACLDVLADVAGLGEGVAVADGEGNVEFLAESSGMADESVTGVGGARLDRGLL